MCGISGIISLKQIGIPNLRKKLDVMNHLLRHRGPDGDGVWINEKNYVGFAHRRLSIIDLNFNANQPMKSDNGNVIVYNGEIYNYIELYNSLKDNWNFRTKSDTETISAAFQAYGTECLTHLRGMFSFGLWDEKSKSLFCARDRFGIKPFYYLLQDEQFYFASEVKALLPFLKDMEIDPNSYAEYMTFQYTIGDQTLVKGIKQLLPGHALIISNGNLKIWKYWDVQYNIDYDHSQHYFDEKLNELLNESISIHLRSDVPIGSYVSGGIDSSLIAALASKNEKGVHSLYHGRFTDYPGYDESDYANAAAEQIKCDLHIADISALDFYDNINRVICSLDLPVAGPGAFPQYMVSKLASKHVKVILGGQGGDEIFGGYARYVLAYFEQCIKAAIDGTYKNGNYVVTPESIIPNLGILREYKSMIKTFWSNGLFETLDARYFRLIDRSVDFSDEVNWSELNREGVYEKFRAIFNNSNNVQKEAYFDKMTHFDFKCLLPALLQVEDRMSMAHGIEARVPFLDQKLVEFVASIPADYKFEGGKVKNLLKTSFDKIIPEKILHRRDKMGFPVPLKEWFNKELKDMVHDILGTEKARTRAFINPRSQFYRKLESAGQFSRKVWGMLSLELWYQNFYDKHTEYKALLANRDVMEVEYSTF